MNNKRLMHVFLLIVCLLTAAGASLAAPQITGQAFQTSISVSYMDDPRRAEWQQPDKVMEYLLLKPGQVIADIGAGTGYFTSFFAQRVGPGGQVYAVDVDEEMVNRLRGRFVRENLQQVKTVLASSVDPGLAKGSLDLVFICDTYLFFEDRIAYLGHLRKSLKEHGKLAIVSFNQRAEMPGSPPPHRMITRETTIQEAYKAGFALEAEFHFLPYQDFLLFTKRTPD